MKGILDLKYPCIHGLVEDWEMMEKVWEYMYTHELRVDPKDTFTLITEAPRNPKYNREKMTELMFESFAV